MDFSSFVQFLFDVKGNLEVVQHEAMAKRERVARKVESSIKSFILTPEFKDILSKQQKIAEDLRDICIAANKKYEDPDFPLDPNLLFPTSEVGVDEIVSWKYMTEIGPDAALFKNGIDEGDVKQGSLGDCWFLSALCGLPCDPMELWVPLIEQCFPKVHGGYEAIDNGSISDALVDLTGEYSEALHQKRNFLLAANGKTRQRGNLMDCAAQAKDATPEQVTTLGILLLHAYALLKVVEVEGFKLIQLPNPWGSYEWTGRWSDGSKE